MDIKKVVERGGVTNSENCWYVSDCVIGLVVGVVFIYKNMFHKSSAVRTFR